MKNEKTNVLNRKALYFALGVIVASFAISLTSVGARVSQEVGRVIIANTSKNPIPIVSKEALKVKGEVEINGNPKVKLDGDSKIKIESIDKPVRVRFDDDEAMPNTNIFDEGKTYLITITGEAAKRCEVDKIKGTWIYCERKNLEAEIVGWVNTSQLSHVENL